MMRWLAALLLPLLAGCWVGGAFYAALDSRAAIAPGDYRLTAPLTGASDSPMRIAVLPDGLTRIVPMGGNWDQPDEGDATTVGFAPLPGVNGAFLVWLSAIDDRPLEGALYGVLTRDGGGYRIAFPFCSETSALARANGARVAEAGEPTCEFTSRAALEAALARFARETPPHANDARLTPR